jgi:hypothetical protein
MPLEKTFAATGTITATNPYNGSQAVAMPAVDGTTSVELQLRGPGPMLVRFGNSASAVAGPNNFDLALNTGANLLLEGGVHPLAATAAAATYIALFGPGTLTAIRGNTTNFSY